MSSRPLIVADVGNSAVKLACYTSRVRANLCEPPTLHRFADVFQDSGSCRSILPEAACDWRVASVQRETEQRLAAWVTRYRHNDQYRVLAHRDFPIVVDVKQPELVGADRLATATAANTLRRPHRDAVVIDAGTAITVDLVERDGTYAGGVILPGRDAFGAALAATTDLLPTVDATFHAAPEVVGKDTESAIQSGSYWGTIGAVREAIEKMTRATVSEVDVFITGGDGQRIHEHLEIESRLVPHLAVMGIALTSANDIASL